MRRKKKSQATTRKQRTYDRKHKGTRAFEQAAAVNHVHHIGGGRLTAITRTEYTGLQKAYDHLNRTLFGRTSKMCS